MVIVYLNRKRVNKFDKKYKHQAYKRAYERKVKSLDVENFSKKDLVKMLHLSLKILETLPREYTLNELYYYEEVMNTVNIFMRTLSIKELKQMYPIEKSYDGEKRECKDYYYTIEFLSEYDENEMIDKNVHDVLWGYHNWSIMKAHVNMLMIMSNKNRMEGKLGLAEKFARDFQIPMYQQKEDGTFKEVWQKPDLKLV